MNPPAGKIARVSVHGGHSGQFCSHAADDLASVVAAYAAQGFAWVGLTEHMAPPDDRFLYPEEARAGLDAAALRRRFAAYMAEARRLQRQWQPVLPIRVGFETEACTGAFDLARQLVAQFRPDYIVGSVHHVADTPIDLSPAVYAEAADRCGGPEGLYLAYFDLQLEMLQTLRPQVVGHFDLVRIFDPDYPRRLATAPVARRIARNLEQVRQIGAILDLNVAAWDKGALEPYPAAGIRQQARRLGIALVPGDDSHGVATVGRHLDRAIALLAEEGFSTDWPVPGA
ncbi:MAG: histidinol-phosphatase [Desulfobacteraceae bacterium]|jgi:histidinol-phosphatase (PHP family)|nr:histidinol-phosphatase [Desulfobacteraceae bacterium]